MSQNYAAIIPAAGLGTRFLPATRAVPKEMLPIGCKPAIHYILEELAEAKIWDVIIVTSPTKSLMQEYCTPSDTTYDLQLKEMTIVQDLKNFMGQFRFHWVMQEKPEGLGHAVLCAKPFMGGAWPVVVLPDMIIDHHPNCTQQLLAITTTTGTPVIATHHVQRNQLSRYGVLDVRPTSIQCLSSVTRIVEKPAPDKAPSTYVVTGRYVLPPTLFHYLEETQRGHGGEIQLTDALNTVITHEGLDALEYEGVTLDTGEPCGWLAANNHFSEK